MRAIPVGLLCLALTACAAPTITATPTATGSPAPQATVTPGTAVNIPPSPSASFAPDCGPLAVASCAKAIAAAASVLPATHPPVLAARVELPTALMTCPPGGGPPPGGVKCQLLVDLATSAGHTIIPLIPTADGGWFPTFLVR